MLPVTRYEQVRIEQRDNLFLTLPAHILRKISSLLPLHSFIAFERTCKEMSTLSQRRFEELKHEERLNFGWSFTKLPSESYVVSHTLLTYFALSQAKKSPQEIYTHLEKFMLRFPMLGAYIWKNLTYSCSQLSSPYQQVFETHLPLINRSKRNESDSLQGGDYLLEGFNRLSDLFILRNKKFFHRNLCHYSVDFEEQRKLKKVHSCFNKAMQHGATHVAHLILVQYTKLDNRSGIKEVLDTSQINNWTYQLILQAAALGEYRALDQWLTLYPQHLDTLEKGLILYPPVLFKLLEQSTQNWLKDKENFPFKRFEKDLAVVIKDYGRWVPDHVWQFARETWIEIARFNRDRDYCLQADIFYTKAIRTYEQIELIPFDLLREAIQIKQMSYQWEQAEDLCIRAINLHGKEISHPVWQLAAETWVGIGKCKEACKRLPEADTYYTKALEIYEKIGHPPCHILKEAALIKQRLHHFEQTDVLWTRAIQADKDTHQLSATDLGNAALVKTRLSQWVEAQELLERVMKSYKNGKEPPSSVYKMAAVVKQRLNNLHEADAFWKQWEQTIKKSNETEKVSVATWELIISVKLELKKWDEVEKLLKKAFKAYQRDGKTAPIEILGNAILTKYMLKKWDKGQILYGRGCQEFGEKHPLLRWTQAFYTYAKLKETHKALNLFEKALEAFTHQNLMIPDLFLAHLAEVQNQASS